MSDFASGRERRQHPRFDVSLECSVSLPEDERSSSLLFPDAKIEGRTRDLSAGGLGLILPTIYLGYDCIVDEGRTLLISLALPSGLIEMEARSAHYIRSDADDDEATYFVGLRITGMNVDARARLKTFLSDMEKS